MLNICMQYEGNGSSIVSSNSEAFASELLETIKCILGVECIYICHKKNVFTGLIVFGKDKTLQCD